MSTAGARHVKALEKVFLGISSSCDEKLQQLESEFRDHQDWLAKTITDTRESKYAFVSSVRLSSSKDLLFLLTRLFSAGMLLG